MKIISILFFITNLIFAKALIVDESHSNIGFAAKHLGITNIFGNFNSYTTEIKMKNKIPTVIIAKIDPNSVFTKNESRDRTLRSDVFFDTKNFKSIDFKMTKFQEDTVYAILTIKGVSLPIKLSYKYNGEKIDKSGTNKIGFSLYGTINRLDFNIGEKYPTELVNDEIKITIDLQLISQK
ncbi:YceI family protein [Campylobacter majalis]|uniref:YceI family protein n=1 Tax=Campylobacter majalis TaxID=2790656 RepID=UPI003D68A770